MRVRVYRNLHRRCWSVVALEGPDRGRVVAHRDTVVVEDACFKVSEAGRQRVLRERRKNVHAFVVGQWFDADDAWAEVWAEAYGWERVSYNPYKAGHFVDPNGAPAVGGRVVALLSTGRVVAERIVEA